MMRIVNRRTIPLVLAFALLAPPVAAQKDSIKKDTAVLSPVQIQAKKNVTTTNREGFYDRKALGLGTFFDSTEVRKMDGGRLSERLRGVPGLKIVQYHEKGEENYAPEYRAASSIHQGMDGGACFSTIIYDNVMMYKAGSHGRPPDLRKEFDPTAIQMIEFYRGASQAPLSLVAASDCGVLVLWSRR